jgi:hypothetical protein
MVNLKPDAAYTTNFLRRKKSLRDHGDALGRWL